jgi:hypothetical protein
MDGQPMIKTFKIVVQVMWVVALITLGTAVGASTAGNILDGLAPSYSVPLALALEHSLQVHRRCFYSFCTDGAIAPEYF